MARTTKKTTVEVEDQFGNKVEVPVGLDGKNPVSAQNPAPKSMSEEDQKRQAEFLKEETPTEAPDNNSNV